jgi:hypothetical protein
LPVPRRDLADRLRSLRPEIEGAFLARIASLPDAEISDDPEYFQGLRSAVSAGADYCFAVVEAVDGAPPPIPAPIIQQARLAARNSVGLQGVIRRYTAGAHLFDCFVLEEIDPADWERLHRSRADALDLLLATVSAEYERENARRISHSGARRLKCVQRLLNGELVDSATLDYDFDLNHVGLIAKGVDAPSALRHFAKQVDCRLLWVRPDDETTWAWLGRTQEIDSSLNAALSSIWDLNLPLAIGEERPGLTGWRESHRHAQHVLLITKRGISPIARYRGDALLASLLRDEVLATMLWSRFIGPFLDLGERGGALRRTLRVYLETNRNGASAATTLGVSRQTVANHLCTIEDVIGTPLSEAGPELELALRLEGAGFMPHGQN